MSKKLENSLIQKAYLVSLNVLASDGRCQLEHIWSVDKKIRTFGPGMMAGKKYLDFHANVTVRGNMRGTVPRKEEVPVVSCLVFPT